MDTVGCDRNVNAATKQPKCEMWSMALIIGCTLWYRCILYRCKCLVQVLACVAKDAYRCQLAPLCWGIYGPFRQYTRQGNETFPNTNHSNYFVTLVCPCFSLILFSWPLLYKFSHSIMQDSDTFHIRATYSHNNYAIIEAEFDENAALFRTL